VRYLSIYRARRRLAELEHEQALHHERVRIAHDIHDDLGARLTRLAMMADDAKDTAAHTQLAEAAREAVVSMDELVWTVNARNDTAEGFVVYAGSYAEKYLRAARIRVRILTGHEQVSAELSADARRQLFLAFKEALNNAVKHSGAAEVQIRFDASQSELTVEITDDGRGFDPSKADPARNGLRGMKERMSVLGARCEIRSRMNAGTSVCFSVPLHR
jgi:signal transduction histidine kinase